MSTDPRSEAMNESEERRLLREWNVLADKFLTTMPGAMTPGSVIHRTKALLARPASPGPRAVAEECARMLDKRADLMEASESATHGYDKYGYADFLRGAANSIREYAATLPAQGAAVPEVPVVAIPALAFARKMFELSDWPDGGDIDGFEFQEAAIECGMLKAEQRTEPCEEDCHCAQYHGADAMKEGVTCYRKAAFLLAAAPSPEGGNESNRRKTSDG